MFGSPKPAFGQTTGAFGGFNAPTAASPFGQNAFGKPGGGGFAATPAFGAGAGAGGGAGMFGAQQPPAGGLFGQNAPQPNTFGGFQQNTSGNLFGSPQASTSLFGQNTPVTQAFGSKPGGFSTFGTPATATVGGIFGQPNNQMGSGMFGQPAAATTGTTGLFGTTNTAFGATGQSGTYLKYAPVSGTDVIVKNGQTQNINTQHHCITCMKEYENKSLEELRYEDYVANRKGGTGNTMFGTTAGPVGNTFGQPGTSGSLFGSPAQDKPAGSIFGQNTNTFGQSSIFAKPAATGFGAQPATNNTFAFGANTTNQSTVFGAAKPFGAAAAPVFSTPTQGNAFRPAQPTTFPSFGNMQQTGNIFGAKPPENNAFGMPQTTNAGGFGTFGAAQPNQLGSTDIFGSKPANFGVSGPVFGGTPFGAPATTGAATGSLFTSFGQKPPETGAPAFGGFNAASNTNTGGGLNLGGGNLFGQKPPGTSLFGAPTGGTQPGSLFGNTGTNQLGGGLGTLGTTNTLGATGGLGGFGTGGLGATNTWGGTNLGNNLNLGGGGLGMNSTLGLMGGSGVPGTNSGVHDRLISSTRAYPYGDSPILKGLSPNSEKVDDLLKPTNPAAQRAIMESDKYKVSPGVTRLKVKPLHAMSKKSLFDGLEEDDPSIQKFTLKPNIKRLNLRPKSANDVPTTNVAEVTVDDVNNASIEVENDDNRISNDVPITRSNEDSVGHKKTSPSNIQKRVGLTSPRGITLRNASDSSPLDVDQEDGADNRRSSWLTSKPLRNRSGEIVEQNPLDNTVDQFLTHRASATVQSTSEQLGYKNLYPDLSAISESTSAMVQIERRSGLLDTEDKENIESPIAIEDESSGAGEQPAMPHPTGIKLTRPGYYTLPSLDELKNYMKADGTCIVPQFTIGRRGYGNVFYDCEIDVANLDIDHLVHIMNKEILIYPDDDNKPPMGEGLNRSAQVTLDRVYPIDKTLKAPITQPEKLARLDYEGKLRRVCNKHGTRFIEYRPQTGSWVFKVPHFSKYGLTNSDEEDEGQSDPTQAKIAAKAPPKQPLPTVPKGLGGFLPGAFSTGIHSGLSQIIDHNDQTLDSVSADTPFISRLSGVTKGLAMDTSEENSVDSTALYPENGQNSFYATKDAISPTSQLAKFEKRSSHTLQLMKASFFNTDTDMDDVASITDQLVPQLSVPRVAPSIAEELPYCPSVISTLTKADTPLYTGLSIKQPIIKPKSVVLHLHNKVLPYSKSIAGRFGHESYTDFSIALARVMKVRWGPSLNFTTFATADAVMDKVLGGDILTLHDLVRGRRLNDFSRQIVLQLHIAGGGQPCNNGKFKANIENFLKTCLDYSDVKKTTDAESCPLITPSKQQLEAADRYLKEASRLEPMNMNTHFGITPSYWRDVWSLCIALWSKHGDPDADPTVPNINRILGQHEALSEWLQKVTRTHPDEPETVFTLLASKRIEEACKLAQKQGDHFLAIMLSMIGGEARVRNLTARQLGLWRDTHADQLIDSVRLVIYALIAGFSRIIVSGKDGPSTLHVCNGLDWIRAFGLHFWYICEPVASISDAVKSYEKSFLEESHLRKNTANDMLYDNRSNIDNDEMDQEEEFDMRNADSDDILYGRVAFPSPPYEVDVEIRDEAKSVKKILDLRYQLISLRASRWHSIDSILNPASHTPDPLDYRLSWLLQQFLEGIGYTHWSEKGLINTITGFAAQLESHGLWYWAIFVLQHLKNDNARNHCVKEMIMRNAGDSHGDKFIDELLKKLGVPKKWIYQSIALKAKYENNSEKEAHYLTLAEDYAGAHKIIIDHLAPTYILNEKPNALREILQPLAETGNAGHIPDWSTGGHLLLEFLEICEEIEKLQQREGESHSYHCESLRMRLANACSAVAMFPTPTLKHTVTKCEIGARLASIGCVVAGLGSTLSKANISPLLGLLNRMDLPSDYIRKLLDKVSDCFMEEQNNEVFSEVMNSSSDEDS